MRILLLLLAILISSGMGYASYLHINNAISKVDFAAISLVTTIILSFVATHFAYMSFSHKRQSKQNRRRNENLDQTISELTKEKEILEKKVRLMERDLRVSNAKALDHTLHITSSGLRTPEDT